MPMYSENIGLEMLLIIPHIAYSRTKINIRWITYKGRKIHSNIVSPYQGKATDHELYHSTN